MDFSVRQENTETCHTLSLSLKTQNGKELTLNLTLERPTSSLKIDMGNFLTFLQLADFMPTPKQLSLGSVQQKHQELHCAFVIGELRLSTTITQDWVKLKFYRQSLLCIAYQVSLQDTFLTLPMELTKRA
ncbi:NSs [Zegla virus]|uniref:NSs n=2 Tax=Orthobunyavirus patoisense TaxID=3052431 RepID=A0A7D9MVH8_9VIRU|nr:NSs [Zegla virus]AXP33553.1 NSs [Zegla virus]QLA46869.1 NSs [Zegla virus]QLA46898.1 NSs [Patois virus]